MPFGRRNSSGGGAMVVSARRDLIEAMKDAAGAAGDAIMQIYEGPLDVEAKADGSPVTAADRAADRIITERLRRVASDIAIVSEENAASHTQQVGDSFFLVDPLDGTKEFVKRSGEFTVNIALIEQRRATLGVVLAPATGRLFFTDAEGGAWEGASPDLRPLKARRAPSGGLTAVVSISHMDEATSAYLRRYDIAKQVSAGSSLKFCLIAAGEADIYPRYGRTMEWDTAAGHAILEAAGGRVTTPENGAFLYGKENYENGPFVAKGAK